MPVEGVKLMDPPTFSDLEYQGKKRKTRRELFLERMDGLIPWQSLEARIGPFYPKAGRGRQPYPLAVMLRIHCVQLFYNLSDPGMEDLLYEAGSVRRFVGLNLSEALPDETTILNFRHLLERQGLGQSLLEEINVHLESQGLRLREATIVDASIIEAHHLLHGGETMVWCDAEGVHKRAEHLGLGVEWRVAMRPGQRRKLEPESEEALAEKVKASVRAKVEPF